MTDIKGDFYEYHKDATIVDEWGVLATAKASDHEEYLNMIPQECKDQVKDYFGWAEQVLSGGLSQWSQVG